VYTILNLPVDLEIAEQDLLATIEKPHKDKIIAPTKGEPHVYYQTWPKSLILLNSALT